MSTTAIDTSEVGAYRRLFAEKYQELEALLDELPDEALLWKPFEQSSWQGPCSPLGGIIAHAVSSTVYLLRRAEYSLGRVEWSDVDGDEGREEFGPANYKVAYLLARVRRSQEYVNRLLDSLNPGDLDASRSHPRRSLEVAARYDVMHALDHLSQHIGHAQLTRQLWAIAYDEKQRKAASA
jgi:hypothetical protein